MTQAVGNLESSQPIYSSNIRTWSAMYLVPCTMVFKKPFDDSYAKQENTHKGPKLRTHIGICRNMCTFIVIFTLPKKRIEHPHESLASSSKKRKPVLEMSS